MKFRRYLLMLVLAGAVFVGVLRTRATCTPSDTGTAGDDTIVCNATNPPSGNVDGGDGNDTILIEADYDGSTNVAGDNGGGSDGDDVIVNNGTIVDASITGDDNGGEGSGDDVIVNNGTVDGSVYGDTPYGEGSGDDTIVNNGTTSDIIGDTGDGDGSGNDSITNNGITYTIIGDTYGGEVGGDGSGSDTITNNGYVSGDIYGDSANGDSTGNDTITNTNLVDGSIYGDSYDNSGTGSDTIVNSGSVSNIYAGGGNDSVTIQGGGTVTGIMDGGDGFDTLTFSLTSSDPDELLAIAAQIAAANPAGGTLVIRGITYVWQNFEQLSALLISLVRLNTLAQPFAVFCRLGGGVDVYATVGSEGFFSLYASAQQISNGIALAQTTGNVVQIGASSTSTLFALATGELQVNAPSGAAFTFNYVQRCGPLPTPRDEPLEEVIETGIIINRPR
jgi:hypothetical protein